MLRPVWAEIDLSAIANNICEIRRITSPSAKLMAVVKANAYGHGAEEVSKVALAHGADWLAVALLQEALQLRNAGFSVPILILGYTPVDQMDLVVANDLRQTIYTWEQAEALSAAAARAKRKARVHVKIDTGMGRIGMLPGADTIGQVLRIARLPHLEVEGIYTHFAAADATDKTYTRQQLERFHWVLEGLEKEGLQIPVRHAANSAAVIDLPEAHLDMVRPGLIIYGMYPSEEVQRERLKLRQAMSLKAEISYVKKVPPGTAISYGCTYVTEKEAVIASLPLGYADGYTRLLSNKGQVLVNGQRAPVVGRVCMDQCMIDVTNVEGEVSMGDHVVLMGRQQQECIPVEEIASRIGTINYEVVCMVSYRVPRVYKYTGSNC
ncbi:MAG: alanine racemase [Thermoanaerobacteraceae bacterium]|nr:alanine racemase [Thermoanaerobacteraceae bacterium]